MSREIKFRAWIKKTKYEDGFMLYENDKETDYCMLSNGNGFGIHDGSEWLDDDGFEIMQFTGIKDKNGKEIYEGDVLSTDGDYIDGIVTWMSDRGCYYLCDLDGYATDSELCYDAMEWKVAEAIGNTYENHELFEGMRQPGNHR